jgi:hypothetical protein
LHEQNILIADVTEQLAALEVRRCDPLRQIRTAGFGLFRHQFLLPRYRDLTLQGRHSQFVPKRLGDNCGSAICRGRPDVKHPDTAA